MSRLYLFAGTVIWLLPSTVASAADPVEPSLEPDAAVLTKLDALGDNSCSTLRPPRAGTAAQPRHAGYGTNRT